MHEIFIGPDDNLEAIQEKIRSTKPRTSVIFEAGDYAIDKTLEFTSGRAYISYGARLRYTGEMNGAMIKVVERPDSEKSRIERMLSNKPILMKIAIWICRLLHIPFAAETLITGFYLDGSGRGTGVQF